MSHKLRRPLSGPAAVRPEQLSDPSRWLVVARDAHDVLWVNNSIHEKLCRNVPIFKVFRWLRGQR
jgi:hypothetical protein